MLVAAAVLLLKKRDGKNIREWIHVSDHCRGIQSVLTDGILGEIYNIGTGAHLSNNYLASAIIEIVGHDEQMKPYVEDRKGHDFKYSVDSSKISSLGCKQGKDLTYGVKETIAWYTANVHWWSGEKSDI